ncbi:MAG: hypothetical protein IKS15_01405 [Opitutales bacterium]|nr:hypothetical protein [Opitutales bacterium]
MKILKTAIILAALASAFEARAQAKFERDFSPAEGVVAPCEKSARDELCLNGYWDLQLAPLPKGFVRGKSPAPELPELSPDKWEGVKIKIPSPINVNRWGGGDKTGEGTDLPYSPSSVYFPSYPKSWGDAQMGWLKKSFDLPQGWKNKRVFLHFDAVAGHAQIFVNSKKAGEHFDSHMGFEVDITDALKSGKNEILLGVRHSKLFDKNHPKYRMNATYPAGSNTDNLIGIWQDAFLLARPAVFVEDVFVRPRVSDGILELEVVVKNMSGKDFEGEISAEIKEWLGGARADFKKLGSMNLDDGKPLGSRIKRVLDAPEPKWALAKQAALKIPPQKIEIPAGQSKTLTLSARPQNALKLWSCDNPNLYAALVSVGGGENSDIKYARFGWRQFEIKGSDLLLNGEKFQAFGDLQHPFGPYICSRRFVFGWYQMIKSFGGNAVRPHAQPWHKYYYDMADEMGLVVLAEGALFGSSIRPNLTEEITWQRTEAQIEALVRRYRNNPSVLGWSVGNEMFAMSLPHLQVKNYEKFKNAKSEKDVKPEDLQAYLQYKADFEKLQADKKEWEQKLALLAKVPQRLDPTRPFITIDGDRDLDGSLPVWSRHFGDGDVSGAIADAERGMNFKKPMVVGEFGATYYGNPSRVYKYWGDEVFKSYAGRNKALAGDVYRMVANIARPKLAYFSPSEVCWFGLEHLPYGYKDFSRLPSLTDGVFPAKPYVEGKPGYQFERIPPYIFTINPGLDKSLPFMRPLAHYKALKAAVKGQPCEYDSVNMQKISDPKAFAHPETVEPLPPAKFAKAYFIGDKNGRLAKALVKKGVVLDFGGGSDFAIADAENLGGGGAEKLREFAAKSLAKNPDAVLLFMIAENDFCAEASEFFGGKISSAKHAGTALDFPNGSGLKKYFNLFDVYFSEPQSSGNMEGRKIFKRVVSGEFLKEARRDFEPSNIDWSLFDAAELRKCAQAVLYEKLQKPGGAVLAEKKWGRGRVAASSLNYNISTRQSDLLFKSVFRILGLATMKGEASAEKAAAHDLLMDGPIAD